MFRTKYRTLMNFMKTTQASLNHHPDPYLVKRFNEARLAMSNLHADAVQDYLTRFRRKDVGKLHKIIRENRLKLTIPSLENHDQAAKLHAAEMRLHPAFSAVVMVDRGVYAAKAIRVAHAQGYRTILVSEQDDETSMAASIADHVLLVEDLGNVDECIQVVKHFRDNVLGLKNYRFGFDPGFGVLSENPALPAACLKNQFVFIGPAAKPMQIMGNKARVKEMAKRCGIPDIPGYAGEQQDNETLYAEAQKIGYPIMMKRAHGGGGTGNRLVTDDYSFHQALLELRGLQQNKPVFLEKFLPSPRHIEVQAFFGKDAAVMLGTRDCSLQRRYQKFLEMAPAINRQNELPQISEYARVMMEDMHAQGYEGPATIEFLVQENNETNKPEIYILEINPRIQVEHGVTEKITGLNLIALKFWIASGRSMKSFFQRALYARGLGGEASTLDDMVDKLFQHSPHPFACQARIENVDYEERPDGGLEKVAAKGTVYSVSMDQRIDRGIVSGTELYNSSKNLLIATPIGVGATREAALQDLLVQLETMQIEGVKTNISRQISHVKYLLAHPDLEITTATTRELDQHYRHEQPASTAKKTVDDANHHLRLFHHCKAFETGKSKLPVMKYEPRPGRSGHWD